MMDRGETIRRIRVGLKARSGKSWSVTGGRGTAWGWIRISAPPARNPRDWMGDEERAELGRLLGLREPVHQQGEQVPDSNDYWQEYIARAEGRAPEVIGRPYWD